MNLLLLRQFMKLAEVGSFTKAAQELFISQPALSKSIKTLEKYYDCKLFDRDGRKIYLNNNGKILYKYAKEIFQSLDNAELEIEENKKNEENSINVSVFSSSKIFLGTMAKFTIENPNCHFKINQNHSFEMNSSFSIFSSSEKLVEDSNIIPLLSEKLLLCVPEKHPIASRNEVSIRDISHENFIELSEGTDLRKIANRLKRKYCVNYNTSCESDNPQLLREMILMGIGLSIVPEKTWSIDTENLKLINMKERGFKRYLYLKLHDGRYINKIESKFIKFLIEEYKKL